MKVAETPPATDAAIKVEAKEEENPVKTDENN